MRERPADLLHQTWLMTQEARVPIVLSNAQIEATDLGTSLEDGASDFFDLLAWQRRLWARVKQVGEIGLRRWLGIDVGQHCSPQ